MILAGVCGKGQACERQSLAAGESGVGSLGMWWYSAALLVGLGLAAPWWLVRMATSGRYRAGLGGRLGLVPAGLKAAVAGRKVVWVHAVSVGEVLAATRLVGELEAALGAEWVVVVSTTTATGQALAGERLGAGRVFYYPLDLGWAVKAYVRALQPRMLVLMESELWPRMLVECERARVPVAVVNARVSDRSFRRGMKLRWAWRRILRRVSLFVAQSEEDGRRLVAMGAAAGAVRVGGNLKYDVRAAKESRVAEWIRALAAGRPVVVAGSTVSGKNEQGLSEDEMVVQAWEGALRQELGAMLVLAPRHPERFGEVAAMAGEFGMVRASEMTSCSAEGAKDGGLEAGVEVVLLDTIGDLAAVYGVGNVGFGGGSLVARGGHSPLEPAQFGVPVVMGSSYENFREVVGRMVAVDGIRIVEARAELERVLVELVRDKVKAKAMGERGRVVCEAQTGATGRTVAALVELVGAGR